tara:strand:- start:1105 stop:2127 length:1023 start_codon:yes stop_codon:yes gene_type:complete
MKILITGGLGYIGSGILEFISSDNKFTEIASGEIYILDNYSYERSQNSILEWAKKYLGLNIHFIPSCITNINKLKTETLNEIADSTYVIHLASLTQSPYSVLNEKYIGQGTEILLDFISHSGNKLKKLINMSSTSIYGNVQSGVEPYNEEIFPDPEHAFHSYSEHKLLSELTCLKYTKENGLPITTFRMSTVFGYSFGVRLNMFINDWVRQIIGGRQIVAPGTPKDWRPFVHVQDASKIILTSLVDSENVPDTIINVGNKDMNLQQQDIIKMVIDIGYSKGIEYNYEVIYRRDQDPTSLVENYKVDFFKYNDIYDFATTSMHNFDSGINDLFDKILGNTY